MKKRKPLNLLDNKGFWPEKAAVADAIKELLSLGGKRAILPVRDYGFYRGEDWRDEKGNLRAWRSVDWYVYDALNEERMQVDCSQLLFNLEHEPWRDEEVLGDHYDLFVIQEDMYDPDAEEQPPGEQEADAAAAPYAVGRCAPFHAAVVSTHRIDNNWGMPYSLIKTEVMRQICFLFGVPSALRADVRRGAGDRVYCTNTCILRPAHVAPDDWTQLTRDRLRHGPLCRECEMDLEAFFAACAEEPEHKAEA